MKAFTAALLVCSFMATSALAETSLPKGKPAGVKKAQALSPNAILIIAGAGLAGVGLGIAASSNGQPSLSSTTTSTAP